MAQRVGVTAQAVVDVAQALVDRDGLPALSLKKVATSLGIRAPSLYAHVDSLEDLRRSLAVRGVTMLGHELESAVHGLKGRDALSAIAAVYHMFSLSHPGLYAATLRDPGSDAEMNEANQRALDVFVGVLRTYGLDGDELLHCYRAFWSAVHGFNMLVTTGVMSMPADLETSYERIVDIFHDYLEGTH
jgi:AcrR family transcriptional regulator